MGSKIVVFFDFEKSGKISEIFGKIWGIFRKKLLALKVQISKIFENFLALKVQKFRGVPLIYL